MMAGRKAPMPYDAMLVLTFSSAKAQVMGEAQEKWLNESLTGSKATWNVIAQQIMMMDLDRQPEPGRNVNPDSWAGYSIPRARLLKTIRDRKVGNVVVLTGDEHQNYAGGLWLDGSQPEGAAIAVEFVSTSISSVSTTDRRRNTCMRSPSHRA
jgi:alkaline phosphatase D